MALPVPGKAGLPSARPPQPKVTLTCDQCGTSRSFLEGERDPGCCKPTVPTFVYELIGDGNGHRFHAIAFPPGQRAITAYGDTQRQVETQIDRLLKV